MLTNKNENRYGQISGFFVCQGTNKRLCDAFGFEPTLGNLFLEKSDLEKKCLSGEMFCPGFQSILEILDTASFVKPFLTSRGLKARKQTTDNFNVNDQKIIHPKKKRLPPPQKNGRNTVRTDFPTNGCILDVVLVCFEIKYN